MRFIHCADIHLDSPFLGLENYPDAPVKEIREATRRSFERIVELAIDKQVSFILIAGDLYDGDQQDYRTVLFFMRQLARLKDAGVHVFLAYGNHDAASKLTKSLKPPANLFIFPSDRVHTEIDKVDGVAIHGQSFSRPDTTEDLAALYPARLPGLLNLGLLHTCLSGAAAHLPYAPTSEDLLRSKGYQYWALGHVHSRRVYSEDPWIIHPGNTQGRHARETGEKSCELVTAEHSEIVSVERVPVAQVLWHRLQINCAEIRTIDDVGLQVETQLRRVVSEDERLCCVRVELVGESTSDSLFRSSPEKVVAQVRASALEVAREQVWIERVNISTRLPQSKAHMDTTGPLIETKRVLDAVRANDDLKDDLLKSLSELLAKVPPEVSEGPDAISFDRTLVTNSLTAIEQELLARLSTGGEE